MKFFNAHRKKKKSYRTRSKTLTHFLSPFSLSAPFSPHRSSYVFPSSNLLNPSDLPFPSSSSYFFPLSPLSSRPPFNLRFDSFRHHLFSLSSNHTLTHNIFSILNSHFSLLHGQVKAMSSELQESNTDSPMEEVVGQENAEAPTDEDYAASQVTLRALVTTKEAGVIIGKQGKNVADLRDQTGVKAGVSKVVPGVHDRVLTVSGSLESVSKVLIPP
jgi:KH domain